MLQGAILAFYGFGRLPTKLSIAFLSLKSEFSFKLTIQSDPLNRCKDTEFFYIPLFCCIQESEVHLNIGKTSIPCILSTYLIILSNWLLTSSSTIV